MDSLIVSLGDSDKEKYISIQQIKSYQKFFKAMAKLICRVFGTMLIIGTISGSMGLKGAGIIGTIFFLLFKLVVTYWSIIHIYGNMFGWGMFVINRKTFAALVLERGSLDEFVRAYCITGYDYARWVDGSSRQFMAIVIVFCVGIWLLLNWIINFKEWIEIPKKIESK